MRAFELHTGSPKVSRLTQPSLTRAIQLLEKEFGGHLFHRERSRIHLTELGRIVRPYLQDAWDQTQGAKREAKDYVSKAPTQLKLAIMCTIAPFLLIQLRPFSQRPSRRQAGAD